MRISLAMCTYNGARYLQEQLESFASQSLLPDELVVCDDGSTDGTPGVLDDFASRARFPVRIFRNKENLGYVRNFAQSISLCVGDIIALSDQDDFWYPNKLSQLSAAFERTESIGGIFSDGELMDEESCPVSGSLWRSFKFNASEQHCFRSGDPLGVLLRRNVATGMTLAFRSKFRARLLPIPPSWEHDSWIAILLVLYSRLEFDRDRLVRYRVHRHQEIGVPLTRSKKLQGILTRGPLFFLAQARLRNEDIYRRFAKRFDDLAAYLSEDKEMAGGAAYAEIEARARFSHEALAALSLPRATRGKEALRQIEGYRRFAIGGARDMLRDLIL
jgi:glycosyltransferase involved in cell wall biosynthesis